MQKVRIYTLAIRPKTLTASLGPVLVGFAVAGRHVVENKPHTSILVIFSALFLQIFANLINDYSDFKNSVDANDRLGPKRVTASGLLSITEIKRAYLVSLLLALVSGSWLAFIGGIPVLVLGLLSIITAYLYSAGPIPLSHIGLGELLAFIFFGPVTVSGTYYLLTDSFQLLPFVAGLGPGYLAGALMAINNLRDIASDKKAGKLTLAVQYGERRARFIPIFGIIGASLLPIYFVYYFGNILFILPVFSFVLFIKDWKRILYGTINSSLNKSLEAMGKYLFFY